MKSGIRFFASLALVLLLSLGVAGAANATTVLMSPNVSADAGDDVVCRIVNAGAKVITVTVQVLDVAGGVLSEAELDVARGGFNGLVFHGPINAHCRFLGAFTKSVVRASVDVTTGFRTIAVAPAE